MDYLKIASDVLKTEAEALLKASKRIDEKQLSKLVDVLKNLTNVGGSLIFCGVGKSGHIAKKLAATFSSLGLPSFFLHPTEALHGDLGRIGEADAVVFISKSGNTSEIMKIIPYFRNRLSKKIALLGDVNSPIAKECEIVFDCSVDKEACINDQAPTTSSTLALAMGDALAVIYENMVGLSKEGFAVNHPGGILGKSMHLKVSDLMWNKVNSPVLGATATLQDVILIMTKINVGGCAILDSNGLLLGIIVEGDIRRTFLNKASGLQTCVTEIMQTKPVKVERDTLALEALRLMEDRKGQIAILPVVDKQNLFLGFVRNHDILKEGFTI
ncbi:MAG: KpsF/GutQ family sugar-phosphate isomerase [Bacteriovoracaceae bacterium]|nr:KpsF/GutQ family sugar-phosphate isomerase [Bacteriovoracaceae bacterium]